jgi:hypothetical protein
VGYHTARTGHHDLVTIAGEFAVGGGEFLGPIAGGMPGAVGKRPIAGTGEDEKDLSHESLLAFVIGLVASSVVFTFANSRPSNTLA